jgi:hypothetical protein
MTWREWFNSSYNLEFKNIGWETEESFDCEFFANGKLFITHVRFSASLDSVIEQETEYKIKRID